MRIRGRPRKAAVNSVVFVHAPRHGLPYYGVIVVYRDDVRWGRYLIIETDELGRSSRGAAVWRDSTEFEPTGRFSKTPGVTYRKNASFEERGCACQCCEHMDEGYEPEPEG